MDLEAALVTGAVAQWPCGARCVVLWLPAAQGTESSGVQITYEQSTGEATVLWPVPSLESVHLFLVQKLKLGGSSRIEFYLWTAVLLRFWIKEEA